MSPTSHGDGSDQSRSSLLAGRRALVTGGGTGIGLQFAETLARHGASVVICGRRPDPLEQAVESIASMGGTISAVAADVTDEADRQRLVSEAGTIDILVNNAGGGRLGPWTEVTLDDWHAVMSLNVEAPFRLCQMLVPAMIERGWGRVVNIGSVYGVVTGNPYFYPDFDWDSPAYVTSKHALIGLSKYLGVRTASTGVTVNTLSPGMFPDTEANRDHISAESRDRLNRFTPLKRAGQVPDLGSALLYLVSPESGFVTAQNVVVDGGWTSW
jgi:NAD(P)-dependent dehydrogenase (short-subunit alcohol dehydrogenase family)